MAGQVQAEPAEVEPETSQPGAVRSEVPGCHGFGLAEPITVAGREWVPEDGLPCASPIGVALAYEVAQRERAALDVA